MLKKELRKDYLHRRKALSQEFINVQSLTIANQLLKLPVWNATYYHIFLSIASKKELDTTFILSILQGKDKSVVIPRMRGAALEHILLQENTRLQSTTWGVPEPLDGLEVPTDKIDIVFVPLLAYDLRGHRVGYGKGYYDRFLHECRPDTIKIGLSLFGPEDSISDIGEYDFPLDHCVTPDRVYSFGDAEASASPS